MSDNIPKLILPKIDIVNDISIPPKPKILLLADDIRMHSGIATMGREIVFGTVHKYDWCQIAGGINHPDKGKIVDMNAATTVVTGVKNAYVRLYPVDGYGNEDTLFTIIAMEKPNIIMHFTDPRYWGWLYILEKQIRRRMPLTYLNIWDSIPYPMYNRPFYESCDLLMSISKQTMNINKYVLGPDRCCTVDEPMEGKTVLHYVPHGINSKMFFPMDKKDPKIVEMKKRFFGDKKYDFVFFYNSRNINRKRTSNIMLGYRAFCDSLTPEQASKVCLLLHTERRCEAGTDLPAVQEAFCKNYNVVYSEAKIIPDEMNLLYNIADVTINVSSNEGFGLSGAESIMAGTPTIVAVTGGLQDQIGQTDEEGKPLVFSQEFGSNSNGKYKTHGVWTKPIWPTARVCQGSIPTPYIFDDVSTWEDCGEAMLYWYMMPADKREACGLKGREWSMGEGGLSSENMCEQFIKCNDFVLKNWKSVKQFDLFTKNDYIGNRMLNDIIGCEFPTYDKDKLQKEIEEVTKKL